jgi:hypothetical protein
VPSRQDFKLAIAATVNVGKAESSWTLKHGDEPIDDWDFDVIGRTAIVESLADYALRERSPIVALQGGLGDGKTSVLNLLRTALAANAIVVSFSAWLPGSEATFASDLFRDVASECRKHVTVPQLRKRALRYARTVSGSVSYLAGLKELMPSVSQAQEIEMLRETLSRVPMPIIILVDDIDRMQKDELHILLKILRGASTFPNVTFICAFSAEEVRRELQQDRALSYEYLEKFFPVTVNLAAPSPELLGRLFIEHASRYMERTKWVRLTEQRKQLEEMLDDVWRDALQNICTNLRKLGLLLNNVESAARPIVGEVNAFDFIVVETLRRFFPDVYEEVRTNPLYLTYARSSFTKGGVFTEERQKKGAPDFFKGLEDRILATKNAQSVRILLSWIFPQYAGSQKELTSYYAYARPANDDTAEDERRVCSPDYFPIYFRAAVPENMFSNTELQRIVDSLNTTEGSDAAVFRAFDTVLDSIPSGHPKREDFLWKLSRAIGRLQSCPAEQIAYAVARRADVYSYDVMNIGEAARALNIVFSAAQHQASTIVGQRILTESMLRNTDDTFAKRLLEYSEDKSRNKVLTDFSNIQAGSVRGAFIQRMNARYGPARDADEVNLTRGDWWAFRIWAQSSKEQQAIEQDFWRRLIGGNRKRLAQAINFLYPTAGAWSEDPRPIVGELFPVEELTKFADTLPEDEELTDIEQEAIRRLHALTRGEYRRPFEETSLH